MDEKHCFPSKIWTLPKPGNCQSCHFRCADVRQDFGIYWEERSGFLWELLLKFIATENEKFPNAVLIQLSSLQRIYFSTNLCRMVQSALGNVLYSIECFSVCDAEVNIKSLLDTH